MLYKEESTEGKENSREVTGEKCKTGQKRTVLEFVGEPFTSFPLISIKAKGRKDSTGRIHKCVQ